MRAPLSILAALAVVTALLPGQQEPPAERLSPERLWQLQRLSGLALHPDGSRLLCTVTRADLGANKNVPQVCELDLRAPGAVLRPVAAGSGAVWSPDGQGFAVATANGISIVPRDGSAPRERPCPGGIDNLSWSPDGSRFAFTRSVQVAPTLRDQQPDLPLAQARTYDALMVRHWDRWLDGSHSHLFVVPAGGDGAARDLMAGDRVDTPMPPFGGKEQICWSPDGKRLCYTARRVADPARSTDSSLWLVDANGGSHVNLTPELPGYDQDPSWSPDGRYIAFCSMARAGFEADRVRLFVHDTTAQTNTELLPTFDASVHGLCWSPDSQTLFFTSETEGTTQAFRVALAERRAVAITSGRHQLAELQVAPDGRTLYALRATMERPAEIVRIDVPTGAITTLTDQNGELLRGLALPDVRAEWFEASDGKRIHAWVLTPPGFDQRRRHPLLLVCQGGPQSMVGQGFSFRWNYHLMAAQGYVVVAPNRRGLPGFGQQWNDQISRDWGGQAMQDLLSVTDAMRARPYVDPARCAAAGASFGGYSVYWLMGNAGDRFACMIAHCGVFHLESMYLSTEELWFVDWDLGGPYWLSPEVARDYQRFSPHRYVQDWRTPLLVIHGELDYRVPLEQGLQAFTAAKLRAVPSRLVTFPSAGHWITKPQDGLLWQREFFGWLDRYCGPRRGDEGSQGERK